MRSTERVAAIAVKDGSPHAPAMTCHPVPYGERRVAEFGFTVSYLLTYLLTYRRYRDLLYTYVYTGWIYLR